MAIGNNDMNKVPVGVIMTRMPNIIFVEKEDSVYLAAQRLMEHQVDSLPVVERSFDNNKENLRIVGKVSKTNITNLFVKLGENN
jgi:CBS domain-containing protein